MEARYHTLFTIYNIVKDEPYPEAYQCRPRQLILRMLQEWSTIKEHLDLLEQEGLVTTSQENTLVITITAAGMEAARVRETRSA